MIYPGSIERVDFGEVQDKKYFVLAEVGKGNTTVDWRELKNIRQFLDISLNLESDQGINQRLQQALPPQSEIKDAIIRMVITYPREWESLIDETGLRNLTSESFEFHLVKRSLAEARVRLPEGRTAGSLSKIELLDIYWGATHRELETGKRTVLNQLAKRSLTC